MDLNLHDSARLIDNLSKLAAGLGFFWLLFISTAKWIYNPIKAFCIKIFVEDRRKLDFIVAELKPNGGSSLRDCINAVKESVARTEVWQKTRLSHEHLAYFDTDIKGRVTWVNKSLMRLLNASESEVVGYGLVNFVYNPDKTKFKEDWSSAILNKIDLKTSFRIVDSTDNIKCMECHALSVKGGKSNEIIGYSGILIEREDEHCTNE